MNFTSLVCLLSSDRQSWSHRYGLPV